MLSVCRAAVYCDLLDGWFVRADRDNIVLIPITGSVHVKRGSQVLTVVFDNLRELLMIHTECG